MTVVRYELTIHLVTEGPLHTGGVDESFDVKKEKAETRKVSRDGADRVVLTGRSVKGAMRAAFDRSAEETKDAESRRKMANLAGLWGGLDRASALTFHSVDFSNATFEDQDNKKRLPSRPGIAVDRHWGTAADTALFEHELVPAGTTFDLVITAQAGVATPLPDTEVPTGPDSEDGPATTPPTPEQIEALMSFLLGLLKEGRISFGARQNAGWGKVRLDGEPGYRLEKWDLGTAEGLLTWLKNISNPDDAANVILEAAKVPEPAVTMISIDWSSPSGILIAAKEEESDKSSGSSSAQVENGPQAENAGQEAENTGEEKKPKPTVPLRNRPGDDKPLVLPGSSVRGALRSRASVIARTILAAKGDELPNWETTGVHQQLAEDPPLVRCLFGTTEHRGALRVFDTVATTIDHEPMVITHNAGDRWTGGVAQGALYSEQVHHVDWAPIRIEIDHRRFGVGENEQRAALCLLGLVLTELSTGTLPLGSRGTRGLGQVEVSQVQIKSVGDIGDFSGEFVAFADGKTVAEQLLAMLQKVAGEIDGEWWTYLRSTPVKEEPNERRRTGD